MCLGLTLRIKETGCLTFERRNLAPRYLAGMRKRVYASFCQSLELNGYIVFQREANTMCISAVEHRVVSSTSTFGEK